MWTCARSPSCGLTISRLQPRNRSPAVSELACRAHPGQGFLPNRGYSSSRRISANLTLHSTETGGVLRRCSLLRGKARAVPRGAQRVGTRTCHTSMPAVLDRVTWACSEPRFIDLSRDSRHQREVVLGGLQWSTTAWSRATSRPRASPSTPENESRRSCTAPWATPRDADTRKGATAPENLPGTVALG